MTVGICEAIPLEPDERQVLIARASDVHFKKATLYEGSADWTKAITELNWAKQYTPDKVSIMRSLAFCYASKGDFGLAEKQYSQCFMLDSSDPYTHADFSYLLAKTGHTERAKGELDEALKIAPRVAALHVDMGWLAEKKGDLDTAQSEFEQAIKLCPKQPGLWLQLAKVLERAGKASEAKHAYTEVLAIDASENEAKQRLDALNAAPSAGSEPKHKTSANGT
jgi:tetratricopeptide (TPR) repeat protein